MAAERTASGRPWRFREADPDQALAISQRHGLSEIVGRILALRGIGPGTTASFLEPRLRDWLPDPSHLLDLDHAADRLARAVLEREPVGIIGDYDVDGATSAALVTRYLRHFGLEPTVEIPNRLTEGYGASRTAFDRLAARGCRLVLTLDNGTTAFAALAHARGLGQEVVVVDHHAAEAELPEALAVVNPNRLDQDSPLGHLAAVGVVFVLLIGVNRRLRERHAVAAPNLPDILGWLDLVALGTVCDVVPLTGLNRALVRQGLRLTASGPTPGLEALAKVARLERITEAWHLGFALGPRINAAGRLGHSALGTRLLTARSDVEAGVLAERLEHLNRERQAIEQSLLAQAERAVRPQLEAGRSVLLAVGEGWHAGVLGIAASRLVERVNRPVFVIAMDGATGRGSARSVRGFDLGAAVIAARRAAILLEGGGHAMAAGLTVARERLADLEAFLAERIADAARTPEGLGDPLVIDGSLAVGGITVELATEIERVAPFGVGNPEPRFCLDDARVAQVRELRGGHLACTVVGAGGGWVKAIAFRCFDEPLGRFLRRADGPVRIVGRIKADRWRGQTRASFQIDDAAPA